MVVLGLVTEKVTILHNVTLLALGVGTMLLATFLVLEVIGYYIGALIDLTE
jgi:hypothetical protein